MAKHLSPSGSIRLRAALIAEALAFCLLLAFAILDWLGHLSLSEDSTGYIVAANNLVKRGSLIGFVNFTNWVNPPSVAPYFGPPPGFPLFLVPFVAVFRDPMVSAVVAQSVYLALFYAAIYLLTLKLRFSPVLRIVTLILFTFIRPFRQIHTTYWTETLFIALSMAAAYFALDLLAGTSRRRDWILFLIFLALSTSVRHAGVANVALIAPLLLKWDTVRAAWRLLTHRYVLIGIFVAGGALIASALLGDLLPYAKPGIGPMQWRGIVVGSAGLVIGSMGLLLSRRRLSGKGHSECQASKPRLSGLDAPAWAVFAVLSAIAPLLAWFARNQLLHGRFAQNLKWSSSLDGDTFWRPFQYVWTNLLEMRFIPRPILALLVATFLFLPLKHTGLFRMTGFRRLAHVAFLSASGAHFGLIWTLSLLTTGLEPIRDRFFSPILAFLLLALLNGLQEASERVRLRMWRAALLATPLVFLILSGTFSPPDLTRFPGRINYPLERQLWGEIDKIEWTRSSSCFYSDGAYTAGGFIHQIFSERPQGIIWERKVLQDPEKLRHILSNGVDPFILVIQDGPEAGILDEMDASGAVPLNKITFHDTGFVLYYLDD